MDKFAVISDIHANLAALVAVLADIYRNKVRTIICLGDIVGYGPDPRECLTLVRRNCKHIVAGNHDQATILEPLGFNPHATEAVLWTRRTLRRGSFISSEVRKNWSLLKHLPVEFKQDGMHFVHGSPRDPANEYVEEHDTHDIGFGPDKKIVRIMEMVDKICFAGHTHCPGIITDDYQFMRPADIDYRWPIKDHEKIFVNVGSVGQPRDGIPQSRYALVDNDEIIFREVAYDIAETRDKILEIPELHDSLATRLEEGR